MSVVTMPTADQFTVTCMHCNHDFGKNPAEIAKDDELYLLFCHQCKENNLLRSGFGMTTVFKVES